MCRARSSPIYHMTGRSAIACTTGSIQTLFNCREDAYEFTYESTVSQNVWAKSPDHCLDHPLARAIRPWLIRCDKLMLYLQRFAHQWKDMVLEVRGRVADPHTRHPRSFTLEKQWPCRDFRRQGLGGFQPDEVLEIIQQN